MKFINTDKFRFETSHKYKFLKLHHQYNYRYCLKKKQYNKFLGKIKV